MNIFVGDPINAIEFLDDNINLIFSTAPWSFSDQSAVVAILEKDIKIYLNNEMNTIDRRTRILILNNFKIIFGFIEDIMNFEFYYLAWLNRCDLIILYFQYDDIITLENIYHHILSNIRFVNLPVVSIVNHMNKPRTSYIIPDTVSPFIFKNSLYSFINMEHQENKIITHGRYHDETKDILNNFFKKVITSDNK